MRDDRLATESLTQMKLIRQNCYSLRYDLKPYYYYRGDIGRNSTDLVGISTKSVKFFPIWPIFYQKRG
jgi:hypothetical protein